MRFLLSSPLSGTTTKKSLALLAEDEEEELNLVIRCCVREMGVEERYSSRGGILSNLN